jgi:hypothetical protein
VVQIGFIILILPSMDLWVDKMTRNASDILKDRYIKTPERKISYLEEKVRQLEAALAAQQKVIEEAKELYQRFKDVNHNSCFFLSEAWQLIQNIATVGAKEG